MRRLRVAAHRKPHPPMSDALFGADDFQLPPIVVPPRQPAATIQQRFEEFHQLNPWVADRLETLTCDLIARGRTRIGIGMLFEVLRWQYQRQTIDHASDFKLNNNYRSRYARHLIAAHPSWASLFELRELKAE